MAKTCFGITRFGLSLAHNRGLKTSVRTSAIIPTLIACVALAACGEADSKAPVAANANDSATPAAASVPAKAAAPKPNYTSKEGNIAYYQGEDGQLIGAFDLGRVPQDQDQAGHIKKGDRVVQMDGRMFAVVSPGSSVVHVLHMRPGEQIFREVAAVPLSGNTVAAMALRDSLAGLLLYPSEAAQNANQTAAPAAATNQPVANGPIRASFDCAKASTPVERTICGDAALAAKDRDVSTRYRGWLAAIKAGRLLDDATEVTADQRAWVTKRNACQNAACISASYDERLDELPEAP